MIRLGLDDYRPQKRSITYADFKGLGLLNADQDRKSVV